MRHWVLPTLFVLAALFCLLVATHAAVDEQWSGVVVLAAVGVRLAVYAQQARDDR